MELAMSPTPALILHLHPLSSCCWKVLIALYENGTPFEPRVVDLGDAQARAAYAALWPTAKIPLLQDGERVVPETSLQIEYLDGRYPGPVRLLPAAPEAGFEARLWDRLFDCYVMTPMQRYVALARRPPDQRDPAGQQALIEQLAMAYDLIEARLPGSEWALGSGFGLADCAAAPALFYAQSILPFGVERPRLAAYFERLMARPSVQRVIREAQPFFKYYPLRERLQPRFLGEVADPG
jgi:glutathione S-transferase